MDYREKKCLVTGATGFIGSKLAIALQNQGANVIPFLEDVRDKTKLESFFTHSLDYVFHFGSPSSVIQFKNNPIFCTDTTINGWINIASLCQKYGVKLIYPSTGLVASEQYPTPYARCKKILEDMHLNSSLEALGLRIFASYGETEYKKKDYASIVYLFVKDIIHDKQPIIYGNGEQTRDLIYIDDVVQSILILNEDCKEKIVEIGSGVSVSFNEIVSIINNQTGKNVKCFYVKKPLGYADNTHCDTNIMSQYYKPKISLEEGIRRIINYEMCHCNNDN